MKPQLKTISIMVLFVWILAACGGAPTPTPTPEVPTPVFNVSSDVPEAQAAPTEKEQPQVDPMTLCAAYIELPTEPSYPLLYCDDFEYPEESLMNGGELKDKYLDMSSEIYKGKYSVRMDVKRSTDVYITTPIEDARDFVVQVDGRMASHSGHPYHKWGLMLKGDTDEKLYYYFLIDNNSLYYFMMVRGEKLTNLINGRKSEDLNPLDEGNTLSVVADGDTYSLYINGEFQEDYKDNRIQSGILGLYFDVSENSIIDWEFDNLVVYAD
jgi:hypothetical protein